MLFFMVPTELKQIQNIKVDDSLIVKISQGDMKSLNTLYEQTSHAVYGFALSIIKNPQDAEDILQETYIKLVSASHTYVSKGKPMALIFTITRNLCLMNMRKQKQISMEEDKLDYLSNLNYDLIKNLDDKMVLKTVLEKLNDDEKQIIMLHIVSGLKHREIAKILEMPLATVLSKYHRTLKKLRLLL